jgi:hypothetical protein
MPKGLPVSDMLAQHGTQVEKEGFAAALMENNGEAMKAIVAAIKKRLRPARAPSTKRMASAVDKIIGKYGKAQVELAVARWVAPEVLPAVSAGDTAQAG